MKVLLDTHSFLWFVLDDPKLSTAARSTIKDAANEICISPASVWEIAIKISLGKYRLNTKFEPFWMEAIQRNRMTLLPIAIAHVSRLVSLPFHHKDPFDRLLVAQALTEQISLVSVDLRLDAYGVARIW